MDALPTGTVTFLYTDLEGSTARWEQAPAAMQAAVARHDAVLRAAIAANHGQVFRQAGDGLCAAFASAPAAVAAALAAQRALHVEDWGATPLRARLALHAGAVELQAGDYVGGCLNRVARLLAAGHGGQTLLSGVVQALVQSALPPDASLRDLGEHRLRDLIQPEHVFQLLHPDLPADFPALRSLDTVPHNLPVQLTSFVGREREMGEVTALLAAHRLVTLTGAGGGGKTRLALEVAADLLDGYADGVWFVDLAPLADPALVPRAVAGAVGVIEQPGQPIEATLLNVLRSRRLLLVLDNCEHLLDASAALAEALLQGCPGVRLLATSREALGSAGEAPWRVPSLATPDPADLPPLDRLGEVAAVRLFVERARVVQPAFAITDQNAAAVAQLCWRLDGMPLAIELAAARLTALTAEQIAARLDDRFRLLTGGRRTAMRRQQTLAAAIDWSHDLLTEPERALLRRLAVFAGGWTLEAAEAVGAGEPIADDEVLDLLTQLVGKSLVVADARAGEARYRLLETIRQYAGEKLLAAGEAAVVRDRHRDAFLALAEQAMPLMWTRDQLRWIDRIEVEHDNLRAALEWSHGQPDGGTPELRLAGALGQYWMWRGHNAEGLARLRTALAHAGEAAVPAARALALNWAGRIETTDGRLNRGRAWLQESRALAMTAGDWRLAAQSTRHLAMVAAASEDLAEGRRLLEEALRLARRAGEPRELAWVLGFLGQTLLSVGETAAARPLLEEGLAISRASGERTGQSLILQRLAWLALYDGDDARARALIEEALAGSRDLRFVTGLIRTLADLGLIARLAADYPTARTSFCEALARAEKVGDRGVMARVIIGLAGLSAAMGQARRAARLFSAMAGSRAIAMRALSLDRGFVARYEQDVAVARTALGEAAFAVAWAEGQALTLEEAVAEALAEDGNDAAGA